MPSRQLNMAANVKEALAKRSQLDEAVARAMDWLDREQTPEGFWVGMLESSYTMEAEWLLAMHILGYEHPRKKDLAATLLRAHRPDGSWEADDGAPPGDLNSTGE